MMPNPTKVIGVISSIAQNQSRGPFEAVNSSNKAIIRYIGEVIAVFMTGFLITTYDINTNHFYQYYSSTILKVM